MISLIDIAIYSECHLNVVCKLEQPSSPAAEMFSLLFLIGKNLHSVYLHDEDTFLLVVLVQFFPFSLSIAQ